MPPTAANTEPKTQEILARSKEIFAYKGFDGASMQDLARATGMSAGNFYRYFPSTDALISAIVEQELEVIQSQFETVMQSDDPRAALMQTIRARFKTLQAPDGLLWTEIAACASRRPEIGDLHVRMEDAIGRCLVAVFARIAGVTQEYAFRHYGAYGAMVMLLVHGVAMRVSGQCGVAQMGGEQLNEMVLRTIEGLLSEIDQGPNQTPISNSES